MTLLIIPDTLAHVDGHPVITHTYSIFKDTSAGNPIVGRSKESSLHLETIDDPNYLGYLTFELPDKLFNYTPAPEQRLSTEEIERLIEYLSDLRSNPALWKIN